MTASIKIEIDLLVAISQNFIPSNVCALSFERTRENLFKPNFVNVLVFINRTTFGIRVPLNQ